MKGVSEIRKYILLFIIPFGLLLESCEQEYGEWVILDPIQCMGNPWEQAWLEENNYEYELWWEMTEQEKLDVFEKYYEDQGIVIYEIKRTSPYNVVCDGCSCPRGDRIHCNIDEDDVDQMMEWGFERE